MSLGREHARASCVSEGLLNVPVLSGATTCCNALRIPITSRDDFLFRLSTVLINGLKGYRIYLENDILEFSLMEKTERISEPKIVVDTIIEIQLQFYGKPTYESVHGWHRDMWQIKNDDTRQKLAKVISSFPKDSQLVEQSAYWVRAISGIHPFPDANHRTSTATLAYILEANGFEEPVWPDELMQKYVQKSKNIKENEDVEVTTDNLHEKDELYDVWTECFNKYFEEK